MNDLPPLSNTLRVSYWADSVIEATGHEPTSAYVEACYLPMLGPSATWLYRRLGTWIAQEPEGFTVELSDLSKSIGLGERVDGRNSMIVRTLGRLAQFRTLSLSHDEMAVRSALPSLTRAQADKFLTPSLLAFHEEVLRERRAVA